MFFFFGNYIHIDTKTSYSPYGSRNLNKSYFPRLPSHLTQYSVINYLRSSYREHPILITNLMECDGNNKSVKWYINPFFFIGQ